MKAPIKDPALATWAALNVALRGADERRCRQLLSLEQTGRGRKQFLRRILARLMRVEGTTRRQKLEKQLELDL